MSTSTHNKKTHYIPEDEVKRLNKLSRDEMLASDPAPILDALRIDYTIHNNGTQYLFKSHTESTPSTRFKLFDSGLWAWKNFASEEKGNIIKLIEDYGNYSYKDALQFYYANMPGSRNYFQEALQLEKLTASYLAEVEKKQKELEEKRELNKSFSQKFSSTSKVTNAYLIYSNNERANEFNKKRGLDKHAPFIMAIKGEYEKYYEDKDEIVLRNQFGIGVLTGDMKKHIQTIKDKKDLDENASGDIHFFEAYIKKDGSTAKTQSFGEKTFSYWFSDENKNKDTVLIFESKFDAAAAYCKNPDIWKEYSGIIANGVNVAPEISMFIKENGFKNIINYNQNDFPGVLFSYNVIKNLEDFDKKKNYTFVKYAKDELKQDINDLYKDGKLSDDRFEKSFIKQVNNFIKINKSLINEKRAKLTNQIDLELKVIDEKLIRMVKLKKDLTAHLNTQELARFNKLKDGGFTKDLDKKNILENNLGKGLDDLVILFDISQKYDENSKLKQILQNEGVPVMNINGNEEFKKILYAINLKNEDIDDDNLELIEDYIAKNKKDEEVNRILDEWIAYCCENNNKDTIDMAKCFYFSEMECILDRKFKLINIGKNLENSFSNENTAAKENVTSTENDLIVDETTFLENDNILIDKEEEDSIKVENENNNSTPQVDEVAKTEPIKPVEQSKEEKTVVSETINNKTNPSSQDNEIDVEYEFKNYEEKLNQLSKDLKETKDLETSNITRGFKKEVVEDAKVICNTIWNRLNEKVIINSISSQSDKNKIESLAAKRKSIGELCKINISTCKTIEDSIKETPSSEAKKINTNGISSKALVDDLNQICSKVSSMVEVMKSTLNEIKKNNEIILEQQSQMERTL